MWHTYSSGTWEADVESHDLKASLSYIVSERSGSAFLLLLIETPKEIVVFNENMVRPGKETWRY